MSTYHNITQPVLDFLDEVVYRVKRNPALVGSAAIAAYSSLTAGHLTASAVVAVIVGFLVRSQVVPANDVDAFVAHVNHVIGDLHAAVNAVPAALPAAPDPVPAPVEPAPAPAPVEAVPAAPAAPAAEAPPSA